MTHSSDAHPRILGAIPQLRTTDLEASIRFYTEVLGLELEFRYSDFYAGICAADQRFHLKLVDNPDPSIPSVQAGFHQHLFMLTDDLDAMAARLKERGARFLREILETERGSREFYVLDDQGHVIAISDG